MDLKEAIKNRRSIRSYLPKPVDKETVNELLLEARWCPSWGNTQPWEVIVLTGDILEIFKEKNKQAQLSKKPINPEIVMPEIWPEIQQKRYGDIGRRLFNSLSIERGDKEARMKFYGDMMELFNAPALLLLTTDKDVSLEYSMLDVGLYLQTFCLLAHERGLGTCILAAAVQYPDILREIIEIPGNKRLVIGVSLGWPDNEHPLNKFERVRGEAEEFIQWVEK